MTNQTKSAPSTHRPKKVTLTALNGYQRFELEAWLKTQQIELETVHATCTDGVAVAKLMKKIVPALVNVPSYPLAANRQQRLQNWELMNTKVFSKVGMPQSKEKQLAFANGKQSDLELLLYEIKELAELQRIKRLAAQELEQRRQRLRFKQDQVVKVKVNECIGGRMMETTKRFIPKKHWDQLVTDNESLEKRLKPLLSKNAQLCQRAIASEELLAELQEKLARLTAQRIYKEFLKNANSKAMKNINNSKDKKDNKEKKDVKELKDGKATQRSLRSQRAL